MIDKHKLKNTFENLLYSSDDIFKILNEFEMYLEQDSENAIELIPYYLILLGDKNYRRDVLNFFDSYRCVPREIIPVLGGMLLNDKDNLTKIAVAELFGNCEYEEVIEYLIKSLFKERSYLVKAWIIDAFRKYINNIKENEKVVSELLRLEQKHCDMKIKISSATVLFKITLNPVWVIKIIKRFKTKGIYSKHWSLTSITELLEDNLIKYDDYKEYFLKYLTNIEEVKSKELIERFLCYCKR